jgi:hypothetical protein
MHSIDTCFVLEGLKDGFPESILDIDDTHYPGQGYSEKAVWYEW